LPFDYSQGLNTVKRSSPNNDISMRNIITIWFKEIKDAVRDRRTLLSSIILPMFLMPLLIVGMGKFVEYQISRTEEQMVKIAVANPTAAPELVALFKKTPKLEVSETTDDLGAQVNDGSVDAGLIFPSDFEALVGQQKAVTLAVVSKSTNDKSSVALARIAAVLNKYNNDVLQKRFASQGINANVLSQVSFQAQDLATEQERGGFGLGFLLPLFIVMWSIVGGQYIATDVSAGEKERKTLEALLLTPVSRLEIVLGKFLAVATAALTSVVVALSSLYFAIVKFGFGPLNSGRAAAAAGASQMSGFSFSLEPTAVLLMFLVSVLLVVLFSAVILSIAIFAKSFKEAQSYIGPSYLVIILPVTLINTIPGFKPADWFFVFPAVNAVQLFKEILIGTYATSHIAITIISLLIFSAAAILVATRIYSKEGVLFRE
jgi:sodium transport system permease protein